MHVYLCILYMSQPMILQPQDDDHHPAAALTGKELVFISYMPFCIVKLPNGWVYMCILINPLTRTTLLECVNYLHVHFKGPAMALRKVQCAIIVHLLNQQETSFQTI